MSKRLPSLSHLDYLTIVEMAAEIGEELLHPENDMVLLHALQREYQHVADEHRKRIDR